MRSITTPVLAAAALFGLATSALAADPGPMATTAKVDVQGDKGEIPLDKSEQVAFMFVADIGQVEQDCTVGLNRPCTMDEVVSGGLKTSNGSLTQGLKYDPRKTDPDYTFTLITGGPNWSLAATPKKPGSIGFYKEPTFMGAVHYNLHGEASWQDPTFTQTGITGDSFVKQ